MPGTTLACAIALAACADAPARTAAPRTAAPAASAPATSAPAPAEAEPAPLDRVLAAFVRGGRFDYEGLRADAARRADLDAFLADVADDERPGLATLVNAYDAVVIREVLARFPLASVMDVRGFFDRAAHRVGRRDVTLDDLEKRWILPDFGDPRVHFALNCAARSCPPLPARALRAPTLDATLDAMTRAALASDAFVRLDGRTVRLSSLFDWYRADFERAAGSVVAFLRRYRPDVPQDSRVSFLTWDWRLNRP